MSDFTRCAIGFFLGTAIGTLVIMFIWGVTDCAYAPLY